MEETSLSKNTDISCQEAHFLHPEGLSKYFLIGFLALLILLIIHKTDLTEHYQSHSFNEILQKAISKPHAFEKDWNGDLQVCLWASDWKPVAFSALGLFVPSQLASRTGHMQEEAPRAQLKVTGLQCHHGPMTSVTSSPAPLAVPRQRGEEQGSGWGRKRSCVVSSWETQNPSWIRDLRVPGCHYLSSYDCKCY